MNKLLAELNRRNVVRVAVAYGVTSWLMLQVADLGLQAIAAPDWVMRAFMLALVIGLPFVLIFSWAFELTPEGIKRESEVDRAASVTHETAKKLDYATIGMLALAIAVLLFRDVLAPDAAPVQRNASAGPAEASVAVLAFENMSSDADQGFFADGLSEELLNRLAQIPELKVAGRTSSFAFKGQNRDLREIGEILNVAYILEGSVRRAGNEIRVTAQLIDAAEGFHLFSETYDGDLEDVFAVQDSIAERISSALVAELTGATPRKTAETVPEAYDLYLRARQFIDTRDFEQLQSASVMLDQALELDADYAPALVQKGLVTLLLSDLTGAYGNVPIAIARPAAERLVARAIEIDPMLAEAHAVRGLLLDQAGKPDEGIAALERALELNPSSSEAAIWLSSALAWQGDVARQVTLLERVVERDPASGVALNNLVNSHYLRGGDFDKATALIRRVESIVGPTYAVKFAIASVALMQGDVAQATMNLERITDRNARASQARTWWGFALMALGEYDVLAREGIAPHQTLAYAVLGDTRSLQDSIVELAALPVNDRVGYLRTVCEALLLVGEYERCVSYAEAGYPSLTALLDQLDFTRGWDTEFAGPLAYAYLQAGDTEKYERLVAAMAQAIPKLEANGADTWVLDRARAELAALQGDNAAVIEHMRNAFEKGGLFAAWNWEGWFVQDVLGDPEYIALKKRVDAYRDAERAKLDLPPYQPPIT